MPVQKWYLDRSREVDMSNMPVGAIDLLYEIPSGKIREWNRNLFKRWMENGNDIDAYKAMWQGRNPKAGFVTRAITKREWVALQTGNSKMNDSDLIVPIDGTVKEQ